MPSFGGAGATAVGTTSLTVDHPATVPALNFETLVVVSKYPTAAPSTPSGWYKLAETTGGAGSAGVDTGNVTLTVFAKITDGTEAGTSESITITGGNSAIGKIYRWLKTAADHWNVLAGVGAHNTGGTTSFSATTDLTDVTAGDLVLAFVGINSNAYSFSAEAISASGLTVGTETERLDVGTALGDDCGFVVSTHEISSGSASTNVTFSMTASGSAANAPAGPVILVRLRELTVAVSGAGAVATGAVVPSPALHHEISTTGMASAAAFGTPVMTQAIAPSGIASQEQVGTHSVALVLSPAGVASAEVVPSPALTSFIATTGIASGAAFGSPVLAFVLEPTGVASGESIGTHALHQTLAMTGIPSAAVIPNPTLTSFISPSSIATGEGFGSATLFEALGISPASIPSASAFGQARLDFTILPAGVASQESIGDHSIAGSLINATASFIAEFQRRAIFTAEFEREAPFTAEFKRRSSFIAEVE